MPQLMNDMEVNQIKGMPAFKFSTTKIKKLGATDYTLVTVAVDVTGSVDNYKKELKECLITALESCKKSPRVDNLLVRVILFSSIYPNGIQEIHGFKLLSEIDLQNDYPDFDPDGCTPLNDATYSVVGSMTTYGKDLMDNDFLTNAIGFVITDGLNNIPGVSTSMIKNEIESVKQNELLESLTMILIGINDSYCSKKLEEFQQETGIHQYIKVGDVSNGKLAKLANFVSQSVSSTAQAVGTGGPSQSIAATI